MSRLGVTAAEFSELNNRRTSDKLRIEGAYTHLSVADVNDSDSALFTQEQIRRFKDIVSFSKGNHKYVHCANSGGILNHPGSCAQPFNMARPGIALYDSSYDLDLSPGMIWKTRVCQIREIEAGITVGYGRTWKSKNNARIATLSVGYADGLSRIASNCGEVSINGIRAPIVGMVSMDLTTVDVTHIPNIKVGDEAELFGGHILVAEAAEKLNTISYELLCSVGSRVPRVWQ